jgi:integrase
MAGNLNKLTDRSVRALKVNGRHSDGGGLYLRITSSGAKSWIFMTTFGGKRIEIGLGAATAVSLASVRQIAARMREAAALGRNPRSVLQAAEGAVVVPTFGEFAEQYIASVEEGWRNEVHRQQWRSSLRDHAAALKNVPIADVDTELVLSVLQPIWLAKSETAKRLRGRIERILDAAKAREYRARDAMNPAAWRGHLALLLPQPSKLARGHHPALAYQDAPGFMEQLRSRPALSARCLEFTILTAARSGEALGATWAEINFEQGLWTVPAHRMKAGNKHVVPLSSRAIEILKAMRPEECVADDRVFAIAGEARSNMAMTMLLRRMKYGHITVHGFRSTFRDWAGDATEFPRELIEQALAHTISNKTERAYRRGHAEDRRRVVMQAWSDFLESRISLGVAAS